MTRTMQSIGIFPTVQSQALHHVTTQPPGLVLATQHTELYFDQRYPNRVLAVVLFANEHCVWSFQINHCGEVTDKFEEHGGARVRAIEDQPEDLLGPRNCGLPTDPEFQERYARRRCHAMRFLSRKEVEVAELSYAK